MGVVFGSFVEVGPYEVWHVISSAFLCYQDIILVRISKSDGHELEAQIVIFLPYEEEDELVHSKKLEGKGEIA